MTDRPSFSTIHIVFNHETDHVEAVQVFNLSRPESLLILQRVAMNITVQLTQEVASPEPAIDVSHGANSEGVPT